MSFLNLAGFSVELLVGGIAAFILILVIVLIILGYTKGKKKSGEYKKKADEAEAAFEVTTATTESAVKQAKAALKASKE